MGPVELSEIDLHTAANFMRHRLSDRSPATVNKDRSYLLAILREARRRRLLRGKWFRELRRIPTERHLPTSWSRQEVERLLTAAGQWPGSVAGVPMNKFFVALILLIVNTGLRIKAARTIKTADVDLQRGFVIVRSKSQKQKADQFFAISGRTIEALSAIYEPSRVWMFPWVGHPKTLSRHFGRICKLAGIAAGGHSGLFHRGRVTAITHAWMQSPEQARQMAGHHSIETTLTHYVDPRVIAARGISPAF